VRGARGATKGDKDTGPVRESHRGPPPPGERPGRVVDDAQDAPRGLAPSRDRDRSLRAVDRRDGSARGRVAAPPLDSDRRGPSGPDVSRLDPHRGRHPLAAEVVICSSHADLAVRAS